MMRCNFWFLLLVQDCTAFLNIFGGEQVQISQEPDFTFSREWQVLGPFQIGTREIIWGADPLEFHGGFHALDYNPNATFESSLIFNGTTSWSTFDADISFDGKQKAYAGLSVNFPDVEWQWLRDTYGWAALQWQGWARGEIFVRTDKVEVLVLHVESAVEYWIDDVHYFGGDFYGYRKAPLTLRLTPGTHRIDVRLFRDVRSMGGTGEPSVEINLELQRSESRLMPTTPGFDRGVLVSEIVGGDDGPIAGEYGAVNVRNDADADIHIHGIEGMHNLCELELVSNTSIRVIPGQTKPIAFRFKCIPSYDRRLYMQLMYRIDGSDIERPMFMSVWPDYVENMHDPHRVTFLSTGGVVTYMILRPPSPGADCGGSANGSLPVMLGLHGAGVDVNDDQTRHSLDGLPDLCAWVLFPSGVTPWSGDDWHVWGMADIEAAVATIPKWIEQVEWTGPGVDINKWLVTGHSNGGQGVWYVLTHRPDKVIAAAAVSGYSSIQNYVPYTFWQISDPGREAILQAGLLNYRNELLLENAQGIPVIQQHGSEDDNVPVYNSRLLAQRIQQAGAESTYFEVPGKKHFWDGVLTTEPLRNFFNKYTVLDRAKRNEPRQALGNFSFVVATPGETGSKNGVEVLALNVPGRLGRLKFAIDSVTGACKFHTTNVGEFCPGQWILHECTSIAVDRQNISITAHSEKRTILRWNDDKWKISNDKRAISKRYHRQLGGIDAILRSKGSFKIVPHSAGAEHVALQISRNLCTYFAADTNITKDYNQALQADGNIISVAIGSDLPEGILKDHPFEVTKDTICISDRNSDTRIVWQEGDFTDGLTAVFLRPASGNRLELVIWGVDSSALEVGARFVPQLTGSGQPDFVVADKTMLSKGLDGTFAMGFFDSEWGVAANSFLGR